MEGKVQDFFIRRPSKIIKPNIIMVNPKSSVRFIFSPNIIAFKSIADGGIIIVQINKFPAPVLCKILKYKK